MTDETLLPVADDLAPVEAAPATVVRRQRKQQTMNVLTAQLQDETVITDDLAEALPVSVTLAAPYGFYADDGQYHAWAAGQTVVDAAVIALLVARGAIFEAE